MAVPSHNHNTVPMDTPITIKVSVNDNLKKLKLPLRDLGATVLPDKLRHLLGIKPEQTVVFERFSDSAGGYITLDPNHPHVFKTLNRAAKAKLKLRLKATVTPAEVPEQNEAEGAPKMEPTIVRSPIYQNNSRDSTALDGRSIGSGIFQFREARVSEHTLVDTDEAPVPSPFPASQDNFFSNLANHSDLSIRTRQPEMNVMLPIVSHGQPWSVYCNHCDKAMSDAHFHCSICDGGDYDLCEECVQAGESCRSEGHWLIKRFLKDGKVMNSVTERIAPRPRQPAPAIEEVAATVEMPGSFAEDTKTLAEEPRLPTRTCNSCVVVLPEREFVTCTSCEDFDLCLSCHTSNQHGHHPAHGFTPATDDTLLPLAAETMLKPGRNVRHNAICDGCDKKIYGVRHKCLNCPDWDYCNDCVKTAATSHRGHRFAPIYQPIADPKSANVSHYGIYCDGHLCRGNDQSYIMGVRYKCAVCNDTDFCASCEAHPGNHHNRTHPLIKIKTPIRNVSITTENEDISGRVRMMGDRRSERSMATETTPVPQANAATQVQTVAEIKPTEVKQAVQQIPVIDLTREKAAVPSAEKAVNAALLNAHFMQDSVSDGSVVAPGNRFTQIWTIRNPGPLAWPAGCSVRFVGGDNMLDVDASHPGSVADINVASESNVVGRPVMINEDIAFKVTLKAPMREGKAISYWRLKAADGTPFGHRLWCDIVVKTPEVPMSDIGAMDLALFRQKKDAMQKLYDLSQVQTAEKARDLAKHTAVPPPAYESNSELSARLSRMHAEQVQKRREQLAHAIATRDGPTGKNKMFVQQPAMAGPSSHVDDNSARKEAAKQRVEHIKAKIMRTREERAKSLMQAQRAASQRAQLSQLLGQAYAGVDEKVVAAPQKIVKVEPETDMEGSQMVFPTLERESPASSTYQSATSSSTFNKGKAAYVENEAGEVERSATPSPPASVPAPEVSSPAAATVDEDDFEDDIEVLSAADGEESEDEDDGFLTDEEYDILDASDQETVAGN